MRLVKLIPGTLWIMLFPAMNLQAAESQAASAIWFDGQHRWQITMRGDDGVRFRGIMNLDDAGLDSGSPLYPGGNAGGFLAAVIAHSMISDAVRENEKEDIREEADAVVLPYQKLISSLSKRQLVTQAEEMLTESDSTASQASTRNMILTPEFLMAQDQQSLVLTTTVSISPISDSETVGDSLVVQRVSSPISVPDVTEYWLSEDGKNFKNVIAEMIADSVRVAALVAHEEFGEKDHKFETVRYQVGTREEIVRAKVLLTACDQMLLENLRGWLLLVPPLTDRKHASPEKCKELVQAD